MGVEPYQLAAAFRGAVAQRLVRRLCQRCRREDAPTEAEIVFARAAIGRAPVRVFRPEGCPACKGGGFRGRSPIAEAFLADEPILRGMADRAPMPELARLAREAGLASMAADGVAQAEAGITTLEEVMGAVDG
jgi:type II secretory ATPase GspE/PulE/Tfp pilus assembly ATPase PilB-like protein